MMTPRRGIIAAAAITMALIALMFLATPDIRASDEESETSCLEGGYNPTPTAVEITAVPISVASTTNDYFVLHAEHDLDGATVEIPVLVKRGEPDTRKAPVAFVTSCRSRLWRDPSGISSP